MFGFYLMDVNLNACQFLCIIFHSWLNL